VIFEVMLKGGQFNMMGRFFFVDIFFYSLNLFSL